MVLVVKGAHKPLDAGVVRWLCSTKLYSFERSQVAPLVERPGIPRTVSSGFTGVPKVINFGENWRPRSLRLDEIKCGLRKKKKKKNSSP